MTSLITPRVFISYARSDGEDFAHTLRERLEKEGIPLWLDRGCMEGGRDWWLQITEALDQVEFMVLVMTPSALSSKTVRKEWRYARQQGVCVYPVKAVPNPDFSELPRWMSSAHWYDLDREWKKFVNDLNTRCQQTRIPFMVEDLPEDFVPRPGEFDALFSLLLDRKLEEPIAITAALKGAGGFGKTTLARALCHNEEIQNAFDDGILWVTLGEKPGDLIGKLEDLIYLLGKVRSGFQSVEAATTRLAELLADRDILMVIDDVWNAANLKPFLQGGPRCARLVTTRMVDTLPMSAQRVDVDAMSRDEAVQLLSAGIVTDTSDQASLEVLAKRLGEWPTLLKLVNGALRERVNNQGQTLPEALEYVNKALDRKGLTFFDARNAEDRHQAVTQTIGVSLELLSPEENERFTELAVFPEEIDIPLATIEALWGKTGGLDEFDVEVLCERLFHLSLLLYFNPTNRQIRLHNVIRLYLIEQHKQGIPALHETLLSLYRPPSGWPTLPDGEPYLWDHLAYHLAKSKNYDELQTLFADVRWLHARVAQSNYIYSGYLADLAVAWEMADGRLAEDETHLADCFRYGLIRTSIDSLAANYVPELVVAAVKSGLWSPERALSIAENMPSLEQACKLFELLLGTDKLSETQRTSIENKTLNAALANEYVGSRWPALAAVAEHLSVEDKAMVLRLALEDALAIGHDGLRVRAIAAVAGRLSGEDKAHTLRQALDTALNISHELWRALAMAAVAGQLSGNEKAATLRRTLNDALAMGNEGWRAQVLAAVAEQLSGAENAPALRQALNSALVIGDARLRATALTAVAAQLSETEKTGVLRQALDAALDIEQEWLRAPALAAIAVQLNGAEKAAVLRQALDTALAIESYKNREESLAAVALQLSDEEMTPALKKALEATLAIKDEEAQAKVLASLSPQLSGEVKTLALRQALEAALAIDNELDRIIALTSVAEQLSGKENATTLKRALETTLAIDPDIGVLAGALTAVVGKLSGEANIPALKKALNAALAIESLKGRAMTLAAVAEQLSGEEKTETLRKALGTALDIGDEEDRTLALVAVAGQLNDKQKTLTLHKALNAALDIVNLRRRAIALAAVAEKLSGQEKATALRQALDTALAIEDEESRAEALTVVATQLSGQEKVLALRQALDAALAIEDERWQAEALAALAGQLNGQENALALRHTLDAALAIEDEELRVKALANLLQHFDKSTAMSYAKSCLHLLENTNRADYLEIGTTLLPKLPLQSETFNHIAKSIIEICTTWKWL